MKKIQAVILAIAICVMMCSINNTNVQAASGGGISVSTNSVQQGKNIIVNFVIPEITEKISSFQLEITFNNIFEVSSYNVPTFSGAQTQSHNVSDNKFVVIASGMSGESTIDFSAGVTISLVFHVKTDAAVGNYNFEINNYILESIPEGSWEGVSCRPDHYATTATVKVNTASIAVTNVALNTTTYTLNAKGEQFTLVATVFPSNADNKAVTYASSNTSIVTVNDNGVVTAVANGTANITVTTIDGGKTATCTVTVRIAHEHTLQTINAVASTCIVQGNNTYYYCTGCKKYYKDIAATVETSVAAEKLVLVDHSLTAHSAVSATHEKDGNIAYWTCNNCGQYFKDAVAMKSITVAQTVISAMGHDYSYQYNETNHWKICSCGSETEPVAHIFQWVVDKEATESETGLKHEQCTACGYKQNENTIIDKGKHQHILKKIEAKDATCTQDGNIEYYTCTSCSKIYEDATGGKEITLTSTVMEVTGHGDVLIQYNSEKHWNICTVCGEKVSGSEEPHIDSNKDNSCDICGAETGKEKNGETIKETVIEETTIKESSNELEETTKIETEDMSSKDSVEEVVKGQDNFEKDTTEEIEVNKSENGFSFVGWIILTIVCCCSVITCFITIQKRQR